MQIGRITHLQGQMMLVVIGVEGDGPRQLETVEVIPIIGEIEHVDRRRIILETTHCQGILAYTRRPILVETVVQIEEVRVVEEGVAAGVSHDALAEIIGKIRGKIAAHMQIKIAALESV